MVDLKNDKVSIKLLLFGLTCNNFVCFKWYIGIVYDVE